VRSVMPVDVVVAVFHSLGLLDRPVPMVSPVMMAVLASQAAMDKTLSLHQLLTRTLIGASTALPDLPVLQDKPARRDHPVRPVSQVNPAADLAADPARLDQPDHPVRMDRPVNLDSLVNPELWSNVPAVKVHLDPLDLKDHLDRTEDPALQATQVMMVHLVRAVMQAMTVNQEILEHRADEARTVAVVMVAVAITAHLPVQLLDINGLHWSTRRLKLERHNTDILSYTMQNYGILVCFMIIRQTTV